MVNPQIWQIFIKLNHILNFLYIELLKNSCIILSYLASLQAWNVLSGILMSPKVYFQFFPRLHTAEVFWSQPAELAEETGPRFRTVTSRQQHPFIKHVSDTVHSTIQILLAGLDWELSAVPCPLPLLLLLGEPVSSAHCSWGNRSSCWEKPSSCSGSGPNLHHRQHQDSGRSWALAVQGGHTAGRDRLIPHSQSWVENHHPPLTDCHSQKPLELCLTLSF